MTDHFAVLRQERRPWLDPDQLKQEFQAQALASHPDRSARDQRPDLNFAEVTEAYRVLTSPRLRLQHLLTLEGSAGSTSEAGDGLAELSDTFMDAAVLVRDVDSFLSKREKAASMLGRSLLQSEAATVQARTSSLLQQLERFYAEAEGNLRRADQVWTSDPSQTLDQLRRLAQRFGFLERWIGQLREKQFQLST